MKVKGRGKDAAEVPLREMSQLLKTIELYLNMRKKKRSQHLALGSSRDGKVKNHGFKREIKDKRTLSYTAIPRRWIFL